MALMASSTCFNSSEVVALVSHHTGVVLFSVLLAVCGVSGTLSPSSPLLHDAIVNMPTATYIYNKVYFIPNYLSISRSYVKYSSLCLAPHR